jgi:hypothetical protein
MKIGIIIFLLSLSGVVQAQRPIGNVVCDYYSSPTATGYSIYRVDGVDIGNAIWTASRSECDAAVRLANYMNNNLVCAKYSNSSTGKVQYSVYRIHDNQDLGRATISTFDECQRAVQFERNGIFCSTYILDGVTKWSMYDSYSGQDIGSNVYASLERCQQMY